MKPTIIYINSDDNEKITMEKQAFNKLLDDHYNSGYLDGKADRVIAIETADWAMWEGWGGNHDRRIEDATCTNCGYKHPTVKGSLSVLSQHCPRCGKLMVNADYGNGRKEKINFNKFVAN